MDRVTNIAWKTTSGTILGGFAYEYDAVGRIVSRSHAINGQAQHKSYSYDDLDRLSSDGGVSYTYDAAGNHTTIDNLLAVKIGGATYYPLTDIQGTVWGYIDSQNNVVACWQYDAWGNVVEEEISSTATALASLRYRFQCRECSAATGLINFRMRWYDAETGRWLSEDPIGLSGGLNLYAFCKSSHMLYGDSLGLFTMQIGFSGTGGAGNGGTVGGGIVFGYSKVKGIQIGAYGMLGDGAYVSKGGGFSLDLVFSVNEDICDLKGVSQTVGGSVTIPKSLVFGGQGGPNNEYGIVCVFNCSRSDRLYSDCSCY